jgi:multicomponent Na+:H+ antiporter subunit G
MACLDLPLIWGLRNYMVDVISYCFIFFGIFFIISAVVGCYRLPDFFCKMHAATIGDAVGCPLVLVGLSIQASSFKILLLAFILLVINPTASYILNQIAIKERENEDV